MAITVKPLAASADKWSGNAAAGGQRYLINAAAASAKFAANAEAAAPNFQQAVTSGNIGNRFLAGIRRSGATRYAAGIQQKGSRFSQGVGTDIAKANWQQGFNPYAQALNGLDAGARGPRGDPRNWQIAQKVGDTLHALRIAALSAGM